MKTYQNDKDAHEDGSEVQEEVHGVFDVIEVTKRCSLNDHLRVEQHVAHEDS